MCSWSEDHEESGSLVDALRELKWVRPPEPRQSISRARLLRPHGQPLDSVTVLSAPVGAGKTTLVAEVARDRPAGASWCTLDRADSDPGEFEISVLEAVLRARSAGDLDHAAGAFGSRSDPLDEALSIAAWGEPLMLVLDDCETIEPKAMHATLGRLVRRLPPGVPLVLLASQDVDLPTRLRAATAMRELRAADLALSLDDVRQLFANAGAAAPEGDIVMLREWTGGLASTVRLAVAAYRDAEDREAFVEAAASSQRAPHIFLTTRILDGLSKELRTFLMKISIAERISVDLANVIAGIDDADAKLRALARSDLFLDPIPSCAGWYQHRHPMRELVYAELCHNNPIGSFAAHARASAWFDEHGDLTRALEHAGQADDVAPLSRLVRRRWIEATLDDRPANLESYLNGADPASFDDVTASAVALDAGDSESARARLAQHEAGAPLRPSAPDEATVQALVNLRLARESARSTEIDDAAKALTKLVEETVTSPELRRSFGVLTARAVADARLSEGDLDGAAEILERVSDECALNGCHRQLALATASLALIAAVSGRVPQARALADADAGVWSTGSATTGGVRALSVAASAYHEDSLPQAEAAIAEARRDLGPGVYRDAILPVLRARIAASIGDAEGSKRLALGVAKHHSKLLSILGDAFGIDVGVKPAPKGSPPTRSGRRHPHAAARDRVEGAVAAYGMQEGDRAFVELECALELVQRHDFRRLFVDSGLPVRPVLLAYLTRARPFGQLAGQLLQRLPTERLATDAVIVETLTERELVVLRYLPSMMLNREIAAEMFFSENTVKTHLKSIYRKFGVTRRRDAVVRARELSLL